MYPRFFGTSEICGDEPDASIEERYAGREQYMQRYRKAAERLIEQRFPLLEDLPAILERGAIEWDFALR